MNPIAFLRRTALIEGVSLLVLVFLAMPLKYIWEMPGAVRVVGMAHGGLWMIFLAALAYAAVVAKWPLGRAAVVFVAGLVPFGPWMVDGRLKGLEEEFVAKLGRGRGGAKR